MYTTKQFIEKAKEVHGDTYNYDTVDYINSREPVKITCKVHGIFEQPPRTHLQNVGCKKCGDAKMGLNNRIPFKVFLERARKAHGDKYTYIEDSYIYNKEEVRTMIDVICPIHGKFNQRTDGHSSGNGCPKCASKLIGEKTRLTTEEFITRATKVHKGLYDYSKVKYELSGIPVEIICKEHGVFKQLPTAHLNDRSMCPICKSSKGEQIIRNLLIRCNIEYKREYNIKDIDNNRYRFDFYLPKLNLLIEFDGKQHFMPIEHFGGLPAFRSNVRRDRAKNRLAELYEIPLIRIHYKKLKVVEFVLINEISKHYKYRVNNKFYRDFKELKMM